MRGDCGYCTFWTIRRTTPPNLGGKWGCVLQSECSLPGSLGLGELSSGVGSQEAGAGSPLQEAGSGSRSGAMLWDLGWEEGVSRRCKAREAGAESPLTHTIVLGRRVQAVQAQ